MIQFQDRIARQQLISEGIVYTVRNYRKSMGVHDAYYYQDGKRKHICRVNIQLADQLFVASKDDGLEIHNEYYIEAYYKRRILSYLSLSGFQYMSDWIKAIKRFNKGKLPSEAVVLRVMRVEI